MTYALLVDHAAPWTNEPPEDATITPHAQGMLISDPERDWLGWAIVACQVRADLDVRLVIDGVVQALPFREIADHVIRCDRMVSALDRAAMAGPLLLTLDGAEWIVSQGRRVSVNESLETALTKADRV